MPRARKRVVKRAERREDQRRRVRMRKAGRPKSKGFFGWLRRLFRRKG